jgi:hypothetical protein
VWSKIFEARREKVTGDVETALHLKNVLVSKSRETM